MFENDTHTKKPSLKENQSEYNKIISDHATFNNRFFFLSFCHSPYAKKWFRLVNLDFANGTKLARIQIPHDTRLANWKRKKNKTKHEGVVMRIMGHHDDACEEGGEGERQRGAA